MTTMIMKKKTLNIDILTIFPGMFPGYVEASILGRAQRSGLLHVTAHQLRAWTRDKHNKVDDRPYGGGPGMVMKVEPFHEALIALKLRTKKGDKTVAGKKTRVILTSAKGKLFTQKDAVRLSKTDHLVFLCGRYEGVDERVAKKLADEELSIGPYVLTGGELPALVMIDAISRLRSGVLGKEESLSEESHAIPGSLEYPQYTRPENYLGWKVPKQLLSGNHAEIAAWRKRLMRGGDEIAT
jgi:tRNA (guanine37-N1)-methyltransferase